MKWRVKLSPQVYFQRKNKLEALPHMWIKCCERENCSSGLIPPPLAERNFVIDVYRMLMDLNTVHNIDGFLFPRREKTRQKKNSVLIMRFFFC